MSTRLLRSGGALALCLVLSNPSGAQVAAPAAPLPAAPAAEEGFAADRLDRLHARLKRFVDDGQVAGVVSLVARHGRIVDVHTVGMRNREKQLPMTRDTIVRIYSMSKIVTSVAVLMLVEEGALRLEDPIAQYLPALKAPQVFTGGTPAAPQLATAVRPITIRHLLTHTSGFAYGLAQGPVDDMYRAAKIFESKTADEFIAKIAALPLAAQPGERFNYGVNTDLLGAIVEKVSGQSLGAFMKARIFDPLGMPDTAFDVPAAKRARLASLYQREGTKPLANVETIQVPGAERAAIPYPDPDGRLMHSGGGGLFSTADDYARFAQMLLNGGELDGVRILGRKTVASMTANQMTHVTNPGNTHQGFGLGVSVRIDQAGGPVAGSIGEFGWSGAATTYVSIDPQEQLVSILLTQHFPGNQPGIYSVFSTMVNAALVR
ncbi:MAG TPA: serine hydrolase domain-containing protein [Luteitalea sp.]|nr:serine hydrolase domain-containing protein [Luteitalea sp.]